VLLLELKAKSFATRWHHGQVRKCTGDPYITHPAAVVDLVRSVPHSLGMLCAAWMHDTVEDTGASLDVILDIFGANVASMVEMMTDVSRPTDGNRAIRKRIDLEHTAKASPEAKTIKLADLIDNTRSIVARDPGFARVYLKEKQRLLEVLTEGDATLWTEAKRLVHKPSQPECQPGRSEKMSVDYTLVCHDHHEKVSICSDGLSGPMLQCDRSLAAFVITHRKCSLSVADEDNDWIVEAYLEWDATNWDAQLRYDR